MADLNPAHTPSPPSASQSRSSAGPSSPAVRRSPLASAPVNQLPMEDAGENAPPSPSSASQPSDAGDGPDEGYGDISPSYRARRHGSDRRGGSMSSRSELPKPKNLLPQSPSTALGGGGWRQPQANTDMLSPANLPHEILLHIFKFLLTRTTGHAYLRSSLMVCRSWCLCGVELLWHRPAFFHLSSLVRLIQTIRSPEQTFPYVTFIRRLNFSGIAGELTDQLFGFMSKCVRLERLAIAECSELSDQALSSTLSSLNNLVSIDLTNVKNLTDDTLEVMARNCKRLQGVNFTNCKKITSKGVAALGENCPLLRRVKFCSCELLGDEGVLPLILGCPMLLEVDFFNCPVISDRAVRQIWISSSHVRELRLANCGPLTDAGFPAPARMLTSSAAALDLSPSVSTRLAAPNVDHLNSAVGQHGSESAPTSRGASPVGAMRGTSPAQGRSSQAGLAHNGLSSTPSRSYTGPMSLSIPLKPPKTFEHLRILDLTNCNTISDDAIEGIISNAPRIRNLGLSKCTRLTDETVYSISRLGKNLQYLHLGHVSNITDRGVRHLVDHCTRIRYLDLANCTQLTDLSVMELASKLPKLKRIGLVRVHHITDNALYALVERHLNLQRVHLSYCTKISVAAVFWLLERLPKVTHISLTGVTAFQRPELQSMCRPPPEEFSATQRESFCVYSGHGVVELHRFLRTVYASEAAARQFMGQTSDLTAEDYRAVHLMRQVAERTRDERRWRYQRSEAASHLQGMIAATGASQLQARLQQCRYLPHPNPWTASSTFPLAHVTTSSTLRYPPELNEHFNNAGGIPTMGNADRRDEEDFPLAPEDWRDEHVNQTGQGWPAGVSSPDFAQMDPRVWSAPAMPARGTEQGQSVPSIGTNAGVPQSVMRHPLEPSRSDGPGASGPSSNTAMLGPYVGARAGSHASARPRGQASFASPMAGAPYPHTGLPDVRLSRHAPNVSATLTPSLMGPGPSGSLEPRWGSALLTDPSETLMASQPRLANSTSPIYGQFQEPVHSRGGGGTAAVGPSSRSPSSSTQPYGVPISDSSIANFPPPHPAAMARSAAASGAPLTGVEIVNAAGRQGQAGSGVGSVREPSQVRSMFVDQRRAMANMNRERDAVARDFQRRVHEAARGQQGAPAGSGSDATQPATSSSAPVGGSVRNTSPMRLDEEEAGDESDDKFVDAVGDASMSGNVSSSSQPIGAGASNGVQPRGFETGQEQAEADADRSTPDRLAHVREQRLRMLGEQL
ncbi:RNI-like protein [Microstroma glucosiphilum]|uniref:RNI-like protein n=1 Tax=Pseudomicrostroma glucosiphilum TaxID=1684307 RepID=A0A316U2X4_9BASI|nr:RNI-like protein [Pseudomicrostroma glucosiphilum]PWN19198.1 RNI-like protein [Pseudomicrostroma glucosiphilum]